MVIIDSVPLSQAIEIGEPIRMPQSLLTRDLRYLHTTFEQTDLDFLKSGFGALNKETEVPTGVVCAVQDSCPVRRLALCEDEERRAWTTRIISLKYRDPKQELDQGGVSADFLGSHRDRRRTATAQLGVAP